VVTHQLQVERRTGKVRQSETDVLPLCYVTNTNTNFSTLKYKYIFQTKNTEAILSNSTRKLLWFEITKILIAVKNKFIVSFI